MNLGGAVAIVTGGGTGIGRAVSSNLARAGARAVVVNYSRSKDDAEATAASLNALGCEGVAHQASVADDAQVKAMIDATVARFARLDVLVNNAGTTHFIAHADLEAVTDEVWDEIIGVNLKGTFYCSRAAAPALKKARGAIVNVASVAGTRAAGSSIPYGVSKAAVLQLTRNLAVALAPEVRVNAVAPGTVLPPADYEEDKLARIRERVPLARIGEADDIARAAVFLAENDYVTGQTITVDGGRSIAS